MAIIRPFKAIRPTRDKVSLVASRSYLSYSDKTIKEKLEHNPFTFLHIINADYKDKIKRNRKEKFKLVKEKFNEFMQKKYLIKDNEDAFYIYQQKNTTHTFNGIIAATKVSDYLNGNIKKHEHTITAREEMFRDYLDTTSFNADPVLLSYKKEDSINKILSKYQETRSEYEFTTTNKSLHKLWVINDATDIELVIDSFKNIKSLYIADGHHRCASSALLTESNNTEHSKYFMSFLITEDQLNIINFNRLIKGLNNLSVDEFLQKLNSSFQINETSNCNPSDKDEIGMYIDGKCFLLTTKKDSYINDCVNKLDPAILANNILNPILNITDEKTDKNISFEAGTTPLSAIKQKVDNGEFTVAFILKPIPFSAIKEVADKNKFMPPKSTYIEPKLRSGLTIYSLD
jgi:uncharacterized protein (DUF1015 family)